MILNFALIFICFYVANKHCKEYSLWWWLNMIGSASNAAVVAVRLL